MIFFYLGIGHTNPIQSKNECFPVYNDWLNGQVTTWSSSEGYEVLRPMTLTWIKR